MTSHCQLVWTDVSFVTNKLKRDIHKYIKSVLLFCLAFTHELLFNGTSMWGSNQ